MYAGQNGMMMKPLKMTYKFSGGPALHNFTYDSFQESAINALSEDASILVAAPTGAGKTVVADHVIDLALSTGKHVIYTAPIKRSVIKNIANSQKNTASL